jgi:hypothetical protein
MVQRLTSYDRAISPSVSLPARPYARLSSMGAAWLAARSGHRVAALTAADMLTPGSAAKGFLLDAI